MSEQDQSEGQKSNPYARSAKEIRATVMRRAWAGETKLEPAKLMEEILTRKRAAAELPPGHEIALRNIIPGQDAAICLQNTLNLLNGVNAQFSDASSPPDKAASLSFSVDLGDYKNNDTYKIHQEMEEAKRVWRQQNPDTGKPELLLEMLRQLEEEEPEDSNDAPPEPRKPTHLSLV